MKQKTGRRHAHDINRDIYQRLQALERYPVDGVAVYEIKIFEDVNVVVPGDGAFYWPIPTDLDQSEIIKVEAGVSIPSGSGPVEIQVAHSVDDADGPWSDVLSAKVVIPVGEYNDDETAEVDGTTWLVADGDWLRCDIDSAGDGAQGLALMVTLIPSPIGSVMVEGAKGDPGGVTAWEGQWTTSTTYQVGDVVNIGGTTYVAIVEHTSDATTEPGVGVNWEDVWMVLVAGHLVSTLVVALDGNGYALDVGTKVYVPIYFDCTIVEATLLANLVGNLVVDIWNDDYGNYPPTDADSITSASPLTLSAAIKTTDTSLSGWSTALAAGDVLAFNVDSVSVVTKATVALKVERT